MWHNETLQTFLDELANPKPTPAGGGAAASAGAMGAALVSMVCNLTIGKAKFSAVEPQIKDILAQSEQLRARLTTLITQDAEAFEAVMAAYRMPRGNAAEKKLRNRAIQEALQQATLVPLDIARACAQVIELSQPLVEMGNPNVIGDTGVAVTCAQAGLKGAAIDVYINLGMIKDEDFVTNHRAALNEILDVHDNLANEIYALIKNRF